MEVFSLLKFWRVVAAGDDVTGVVTGGGCSDTDITTISSSETTANVGRPAVESDEEEDSFFDLEFTTPDSEKDSAFVGSPNDVFFKGRVSPSEEPTSNPQSPMTSFLRSPPKFGVFMLFKKPKMEKAEAAAAADVLPPATMKHRQLSKRFAVKCKVEEVPIFSLLARVNSSRSNLQNQRFVSDAAPSKHFAKDWVQKYMKLIKPLYIRPSKRYSEKMKFTDELSTSTPLSSPSTAPAPARSPRKISDDKKGSRQVSLRVACKNLGKSRSASSAVRVAPPPPVSRRDDSLLLQHDGIQSAILHCKRSYNSSREFSAVSSNSPRGISVNPPRTSIEEVKKRCSI